jgi:proteasome lid subunit RPN8/RPN11
MKISQWLLPSSVVQQTEFAFRSGKHEVFAIWTASKSQLGLADHAVPISRGVIPKQTPGATPTGVYVHIEGAELQRIQLDNFDRSERSIIQLHTHPGVDVRMSKLDREWEVVRHVGALSIIVPFYGQQGLMSFEGVNVYEREEHDWRLWSRIETAERIKII